MSSRSRRPYLIRAIFDWTTQNGYTPHMLVAADYPGVVVPREFVQDGRITLNISPMAVQNLDLSGELVWFSARFGGRPFDVQVPCGAVIAVFARENGEGIMFGEVEPPMPDDGKPKPEAPKAADKPEGKRAHLKLVK
ncbi:MAG: ClpXP protease specificity-enhancing factor [Nevskiaceae bacterium]|nr:MAG: ClpXP protease specificity-enhancing factor [Nevskiaceae bacterium]